MAIIYNIFFQPNKIIETKLQMLVLKSYLHPTKCYLRIMHRITCLYKHYISIRYFCKDNGWKESLNPILNGKFS